MGISNLRLGLENLHATLRGEVRQADKELKAAQAVADRLESLFWERQRLNEVVHAVETVLRNTVIPIGHLRW